MIRLVDHRGVMHYARHSAGLGEALCGSPPVGTTVEDPPGGPVVYSETFPEPEHDSVCEVCSAMLGRTP